MEPHTCDTAGIDVTVQQLNPMSLSLRVSRFDITGQAVATREVGFAGSELVHRIVERQPEYSALVTEPTHRGHRGRNQSGRHSTLTVIENTPGMVEDTGTRPASPDKQPPRHPGGTAPPQNLATPQRHSRFAALLSSTGSERTQSALSTTFRRIRTQSHTRSVSATPTRSRHFQSNVQAKYWNHHPALLSPHASASSTTNAIDSTELENEEEIRLVPHTVPAAASRPVSTRLVQAFERARQLAESIDSRSSVLTKRDVTSGGSTKSPLLQMFTLLEQEVIFDRIEQQKFYKNEVLRLEQDYAFESSVLRAEMERSKKIHRLVRFLLSLCTLNTQKLNVACDSLTTVVVSLLFQAQKYHLGRMRQLKEQIHTLEQSIAVVRQRNSDLSNHIHSLQGVRNPNSRLVSASETMATSPIVNDATEHVSSHERSSSVDNNSSTPLWGIDVVEEPFCESGDGDEVAVARVEDEIVDVDIETLLCPITQEEFEDPVVAADGHTYERGGILQWLEKHDTSPLTGAQLSSKQLFANWTLRSVMSDYKRRLLEQRASNAPSCRLSDATSSPTQIYEEVADNVPSDATTRRGKAAGTWSAAAAAVRQGRSDYSGEIGKTQELQQTKESVAMLSALSKQNGSQTCIVS